MQSSWAVLRSTIGLCAYTVVMIPKHHPKSEIGIVHTSPIVQTHTRQFARGTSVSHQDNAGLEALDTNIRMVLGIFISLLAGTIEFVQGSITHVTH